MKKIVSIFLVTIYGMCMVACGSRSSSTEVKDNVLTEEEKAKAIPCYSMARILPVGKCSTGVMSRDGR